MADKLWKFEGDGGDFTLFVVIEERIDARLKVEEILSQDPDLEPYLWQLQEMGAVTECIRGWDIIYGGATA